MQGQQGRSNVLLPPKGPAGVPSQAQSGSVMAAGRQVEQGGSCLKVKLGLDVWSLCQQAQANQTVETKPGCPQPLHIGSLRARRKKVISPLCLCSDIDNLQFMPVFLAKKPTIDFSSNCQASSS